MVAACLGKQKEDQLGIGTWSVREIAVTAKSSGCCRQVKKSSAKVSLTGFSPKALQMQSSLQTATGIGKTVLQGLQGCMAMEGMMWKKNSNRYVFEKDRVVKLAVFCSRDGSEDGPGRP